MKKVHYFQRFSKKEDVVTNNTLLLFERLQHENARLFEQILRELMSKEVSPQELTVGAELTQQERAKSGTIADGVIRQRSFHIVLETKLHTNFNVSQLQGHLASFDSSGESLQVLLLLGTAEPADLPAAQQVVAAHNAQHKKSVQLVWITFADVVKTCKDVIPEHEFMMLEMLDDYEHFCIEEGLNNDAELLVVNCARSLEDNLQFCLYYHQTKPHPQRKFIGFYADKAVQAIGVLEKVVRVDRTANGLHIVGSHDLTLTPKEQTRIARSMDNASKRGWDITSKHYFFLAGRVEQTLFQKKTKFPLRGVWKYFDLREVLGLDAKMKLPELSPLAQELRNKTW